MNGALYLKEEIKYITYYVNKFRYLQFVFIPMTYSQIIANCFLTRLRIFLLKYDEATAPMAFVSSTLKKTIRNFVTYKLIQNSCLFCFPFLSKLLVYY